MSETVTQTPKPTRKWYQKKRFIIPLILIVLFVIGVAAAPKSNNTSTVADTSSKVSNTNTANEPAKPAGPKEGDVISGIGRKDLEDKYNSEKKLSKFKADAYAKSLVGQDIVWVGKVDNVDTNPINNTPYINIKMGIYTVRAYDPASKWAGTLIKGDLVKLTGKIDSLYEFIGVDVYVNATDIAKV